MFIVQQNGNITLKRFDVERSRFENYFESEKIQIKKFYYYTVKFAYGMWRNKSNYFAYSFSG